MLSRLRSTFFAWTGALILALSASGLVAAATLVGDTSPTTDGTTTPPAATDTTTTFVDLNGDGIADSCQADVVADPIAAAAALKAADTNGDGTISVDEAAHTDWVGGPNCNHGGYVSGVAGASGDDQETTDPSVDAPAQNETPKAGCPAVPPVAPTTTTGDQPPTDTAPNAHGLAVSTVAQSAAVGGKNCNHGGAVSAAAHGAHGAGAQNDARKALHANAPVAPHSNGHRWGHAKP